MISTMNANCKTAVVNFKRIKPNEYKDIAYTIGNFEINLDVKEPKPVGCLYFLIIVTYDANHELYVQ